MLEMILPDCKLVVSSVAASKRQRWQYDVGMRLHSPKGIFESLIERALRPLATAAFFVLVAFLWTLLLQHFIAYPFVFLFFGAVIGSAWFGGTVAGFMSVVLSATVIAFFFVPPLFSIRVDVVSRSYYIAFILSATVMSWVSSARKRSETAIREARDRLEERVLERTAEIERAHLDYVESERRLRLVTEAIPQQIWTAKRDGTVEYCNQHLLDFLGCSAEEIRKQELIFVLHPDDQDAFQNTRLQAINSGKPFEGEWRMRGANGQYRWFLVRSVPQISADGNIACWYGTHIDIEERRRAEQALLEAQLELSHIARTLSMGELTAFIAHELNQPLTAVLTNAYACRRWLGAKPLNLDRAVFTADQIIEETTRAGAIVARVRALFLHGEQVRREVNINIEVQTLVERLRDEAIRRDVIIRTKLALNLPRVAVDAVQIQQVIFNLAVNGMDAMTDVTGVRELCISTERAENGDVLVTVEDGGAGFDAEAKDKVFQPFFTTKEKGVGLGLTISRTIIEAHKGRIWAAASEGGGAAFRFTIPASL
jgi:PAS domain S-box-containing protein